MATIENYSKLDTIIVIDSTGYVIKEKKDDSSCHGIGGFTSDNQLVGVYVENKELYFILNSKMSKLNPDTVNCQNKIIEDGKRKFELVSDNTLICSIIYKPFLSPFLLAFDEDEDEFDVLLYLSELLGTKEIIRNYIYLISSQKI